MCGGRGMLACVCVVSYRILSFERGREFQSSALTWRWCIVQQLGGSGACSEIDSEASWGY